MHKSEISLFRLPDLSTQDFSKHNEESDALWKAFVSGTHPRIPVRFNTNPRVLMLDPRYNTRGITYREYMTDPEIMAQAMLEWQYWMRFVLPGDQEKGLPRKWTIWTDFENSYDAAWLGCPVHYREDQVPDTTPILDDDHKRMLFDRGVPGPFAGEWCDRWAAFMDAWEKKSRDGWTFLGVPVEPNRNMSPFAGCDGLFTVAVSLRGATEMCIDLMMDPEYAHELLAYLYESLTARMKAWRVRCGIPVPQDAFGSADDAVEMLSTDQYREFVLPWHVRFFDVFGTAKDRGMHLCGDAQRHFATLHKETGIQTFDTGFPVDFARFRRELGPDVSISGGPAVSFFIQDSPEPIVRETQRILRSGILQGGRFILQEGNNLPPAAHIENCQAVYDTGRQLGSRSHWA